jgi:hypothetical protein
MFADTGVTLPARRRDEHAPRQVADTVAEAIERDRGELDVAPLPDAPRREFAGLAPEVSAKVARRAGSDKIAADMASAQDTKR